MKQKKDFDVVGFLMDFESGDFKLKQKRKGGQEMRTEFGWHFAKADNRLNYDDKRPITIGGTHTVQGELKLCGWGLHASKRIIDALRYAPGPVIYRVRLSGEILIGDDKMCATERTYLWGYDATEILWAFARRCALDVIHLWPAPDVVLTYLKTGDESLRREAWAAAAAAAAARDAAQAAARNAAAAAARDAAQAAARNAAAAAARNAAQAAAWAAAADAARNAAAAAARNAAQAAAWAAAAAADAAADAAQAKQNRRLTSMITAGRR